MTDLLIPRPLRDMVDRELESNERINWMGMPKRVFFTRITTFTVLFGLPWTAFAVFWTVGAASIGKDVPFLFGLLFPLFGLPFIMIGLLMMLSPIGAYRRSAKTVYVITDRRAITFDSGWTTTVRSYSPEKLKNIFRKEKRDGSGDIIFTRRAYRDSDGDRQSEELGFIRIANVKDVEHRLKDLAKQMDAAES